MTPEEKRKRQRASSQKWREKNKKQKQATDRWRALLRRYGISREDFDRLLKSQRGRCAICGGAMMGPKEPAVDHDHATDVVRALLCLLCNSMLGKARDDARILRAGARYLDRFTPERD